MVKKFIFGLILFTLQHSLLPGQLQDNVLFDRISSEYVKLRKGLSQNTVYAIMQDETGYMWFGTWDGLNKYDGNGFTIYNKTNGLTSETIYALMQSSDGRIWIGTEDGLNTFDPKSGKIRNYQHIEGDTTSLSNNRINQIYQDRLGRIWIATIWGMNLYVPEKDHFIQYLTKKRDNTSVRSNWINQIYQDKDLNSWYASRHGLVRFDRKNKIVTRYYHKPGDQNSLCSNIINTLCEDKNGNLWIGTNRGLSKLDTRTKMFHNYYHDPQEPSSLSDNTINCIYEDSQGNLWIGTNDGGLNLYNRKNDGFISFEHNVNNTNSLSNNRILTICESHAGTLWIGTFKGVSKIDNKSSKFTVYRNDPGTENSLNNNFVRDFIEMDTGLIWIATDGGINIFNEDTDDFTYITKQAGNKNSLSSNYIRDMYLDNDGFVWLGTSDSGLMKINRNGKVLKKYIHDVRDSTSLSGSFITYISMDRDGDLWVATNNGLSRLKNGTDRFVNYNISLDDESTDKFVRIYDMYQHEDGRIWFASQNGLTQYFPEQDSFSSIYIDPVLEGQIASNKLFSIRRQNDSIFWLGTRGGGLVKFNTYSNTFNIYTEEDGLPNNVVYGFLTDDRENFWISTNWGLSRFNPDQESFVNYDAKDGLQSYEFNGNALLKASNGKMYFGGMNGFNCFYPGEIKTNTNIPPIEITSFKVFNEALPYAQLQKDSIYLNHDDNFFSFEFAALDYTNPSKNKYRYKLEGVDKDWRETDASKPAAEYTKVSPGTYTFRVIGSNNDGYWNYEGKELTIIISPAWWNSWAFRVPVILLVFGLLSYFLYFRFKSIRKEHEAEKRLLSIEKQMFDIEQKALQLQMNPHFIFNSLNSIQSFVISNDTDKAINYLAKFSHLMRLILANSRETYVPLKDELTALKHYMDIEKLRFDDKFDYEINISREIDEEFYEIPPMLLQPYVENAIIHGLINSEKKGRINISFNLEGGKIHCFIEDNGIGREQSEILKKQSGFNRKSRGLMITKERLELLSKQQKQKFSVKIIDLKNSRGEALGTRVELIILFRES